MKNENPQETANSHWLEDILWNIAGFKKSIIAKCGVDSYHAKIIGVLLLLVGVYAAMAWTFFFQTFTQNVFIAVLAGLFMGFFIISLDRALISSMSSSKMNYYSLGFRLLLAIILGVFLSQPMILRFYQPEISREVSILADKKVQERKVELELLYKSDMDLLITQKTALEAQIAQTQTDLSTAEEDFKAEMDGSAGTKKYGYSTVAKQKEKILKRYTDDLAILEQIARPRIDSLQAQINGLSGKIAGDINTYQNDNKVFGTLIKAVALQSLLTKDSSGALRFRYYLLSLILVLIELSALIAKMLFKTESYKAKMSLISTEELLNVELEKAMRVAKLEDLSRLELENELALQAEFFAKAKNVNSSKLDGLMAEWKSEESGTAKYYWAKFKEMISFKD